MHDFNLAYIITYAPARPVEIGLGVCLAHWFTLDERKTTPWTDTVINNAASRSGLVQWMAYVDPVTHDTTPYTFRGIKAMAHITVDPVWFLRWWKPLGKEDIKLYSEGAILGVQNYPGWYNNITQRMPVMFGCNAPTFGLLDILSVEAEYYASPYWNDPYFVWVARSPVPFTGDIRSPDPDSWVPKNDNHWKWAIYGSRKINKLLRLSGQVASDHLSEMQFSGPPPSPTGYREVCPRTQDWYFMLRAMVYF